MVLTTLRSGWRNTRDRLQSAIEVRDGARVDWDYMNYDVLCIGKPYFSRERVDTLIHTRNRQHDMFSS